jgi:hypothetical protein
MRRGQVLVLLLPAPLLTAVRPPAPSRIVFQGFFWALLSGLSEPVGGLIGYLALYDGNGMSYALIFSMVAGMMVYISVRELLPTALRYDVQDRVTTIGACARVVGSRAIVCARGPSQPGAAVVQQSCSLTSH